MPSLAVAAPIPWRPAGGTALPGGRGPVLPAGRCAAGVPSGRMLGMSLIHGLHHPDPVVRVRGLMKSYGGRTLVDRLDLHVHARQGVGLIGGNRAGKTTP